MKSVIFASALLTIVPQFADAWIRPDPIDYKRQFREADLVAIVRVEDIGILDGFEQLDSYPKAQFKRIKVSFQVETILKGEAPTPQECELMREATVKELSTHFPHNEYRRLALASAANEEIHHYISDLEAGKFYLCFLTKSTDGQWFPTTGFEKSSYSFIEVNPPARAMTAREGDGGAGLIQKP